MNRACVLTLVLLCLLGVGVAENSASVPRFVKFSGSVAGHRAAGSASLTFSLYSSSEGGAPIWQETQAVPLDAAGKYNVLLGAGSANGLPIELFAANEARWLQVSVNGKAQGARVLLVSVPYALKAEEADRIGGLTAQDLVSRSELRDQVQNSVQSFVNTSAIQGAVLSVTQPLAPIATTATNFTDTTADQVVKVTQSGTGRAISATSATDNNAAIYGSATGTANRNFGIIGSSDSPTGVGVLGQVTNAAGGNNIGVWGTAKGPGGTGILGESVATTGAGFGLRGKTLSNAGTGLVGYAQSTTGSTIGVYGLVYSPAGTALRVEAVNTLTTGKLISARTGANEVMSVNGSGEVTATKFIGDGSGLTNLPSVYGPGDGTNCVSGFALGVDGSGNAQCSTDGSSLTNLTAANIASGTAGINISGNAATATTATSATSATTAAGLSATLDVAHGGTGLTTATAAGRFLRSSSASAWAASTIATADVPSDVRTRVITYLAGCDSCSALTTSDTQNDIFVSGYTSLSVTSVSCYVDAGSGTVINVQKNSGGSTSNLLASNLTCSTSGASAGSTATLVSGDRLNFILSTADTVAKRATIVIKATIN